MKYQGSKNRIAKYILPLITERLKPEQWYVEPFMGGANMMDKVEHSHRIGADLNYHLIEMWRALQKGWMPPENVSRDEHTYLKQAQDIEDPALVAFVGICCSHSGRWFTGYASCKKNRNYAREGRDNLMKQIQKLDRVVLECSDYRDLDIPAKSLIYCDPPYKGTADYLHGLDHDIFWQWCREKAREGHTVLISEYSAPDDFICLLEIEHYTSMTKDNKSKRIEKIFNYDELF